MKVFKNLGDDRSSFFCVYCGGSTETRDHVPSRIFLDEPYPPNLPVVPCCGTCNNGFSQDEEYVAVFLECVVNGTTDPDKIKREKIKKALAHNSKLRRLIEESKQTTTKILNWLPDHARIENVIMKLARGHAAFELHVNQFEEPTHFTLNVLPTMTDEEFHNFETQPDTERFFPEMGSRAMQRLFLGDENFIDGWVIVQEGRYRYMTAQTRSISTLVRGVIGEYLAYEVVW
jgi:hypothetical protein